MLLREKRFYATYVELKREALSPEEKAALASAKVVDSQFGLAVLFTFSDGGFLRKGIAKEKLADAKVGEVIDLDKIQEITLQQGDKEITKYTW